jgi:hypothetical protein
MIGGPGWSVHIQLPVHYTGGEYPQIRITKGTYCNKFAEVYHAIGTATGRDISADYHEWIMFVEAVWPEAEIGTHLQRPIKISIIAKIAGVNTAKIGLKDLVWRTLGAILAKSNVSRGDSTRALPYEQIAPSPPDVSGS